MTTFIDHETWSISLFHLIISIFVELFSMYYRNFPHSDKLSFTVWCKRPFNICTTSRDGQEGFISYVSTTKDSLNNLVKKKISLCDISSENPFDVWVIIYVVLCIRFSDMCFATHVKKDLFGGPDVSFMLQTSWEESCNSSDSAELPCLSHTRSQTGTFPYLPICLPHFKHCIILKNEVKSVGELWRLVPQLEIWLVCVLILIDAYHYLIWFYFMQKCSKSWKFHM